MSLAQPVRTRVNPSNPTQRYRLWGNGRIDAIGGAPPITDSQASFYQRTDQPVCVDFHVLDWSTGEMLILDMQGGFQPANGATDPMHTDSDGNVTNDFGAPFDRNGRRFVRWEWDPAGTGQGYLYDGYGQIFPFGGATDPPRTGPRFGSFSVRGVAMQWSPTKKVLMVDNAGGVWADFDAVAPTPPPFYFRGRDVARDIAVTDWSTSSGYVMTGDGALWVFGSAPAPGTNAPYRAGQDLARVLTVLSAADPEELLEDHAGGGSFDFFVSTPPSVTAGGVDSISPVNPTTDTTRPTLAWTYSDPQHDSQAVAQWFLFTQAYVDANSAAMAHPDLAPAVNNSVAHDVETNPSTHAVTCPVDLDNGDYRFYVRVQDTAGQWSDWDDYGWTQAVPVPATPTGLTAVADQVTASVALSVTTGADAQYVRFDASDDGEVTWAPVIGAEQLPCTATTTATDRFPPQGVARKYKATAYSTDPHVASASSATASATITTYEHLLHAVDDDTLGGVVRVVKAPNPTRTVTAGVFATLGDKFYTVIRDGQPKARKIDLGLEADQAAEWDKLEALVESDSTLVWRDPFGKVGFFAVAGDFGAEQIRAAREESESTPYRHLHSVDLPLVEVRPPVADV